MPQDLNDFQLPGKWDLHLKQIENASKKFWTEHRIKSYARLQSMKVWYEFRRWLVEISRTLLVRKPLTSFETFLLHAAAYLYEVGWQATDAPHLSITERYAESGRMIRQSVDATTRGYDFGLLSLDDTTTVDVLAQLCTSTGFTDLSSLSSDAQPGSNQETVRLRYLAAILQFANLLLYSERVNKTYIYSLNLSNKADARLALLSYVKLVSLENGGLRVSFRINSQDEHLAGKMNALYEEPIRIWWLNNCDWLSQNFHFSFTIHKPNISIVYEGLRPPLLATTCKALPSFLEAFQPLELPLRKCLEMESSVRMESPARAFNKIIDPKTRKSAFICYSHKDERFLKELQTHLAPFIRKEGLSIWDDTMIQAGSKLNDAIENALHKTKVAVLLVSAEFLASDSIANKELPFLLAAAEQEGAIILPVILTTCAFEYCGLGQFKAVNDPSNPLKPMKPADRDKVWNRVAENVRDALKEVS